MWFIDAANQLEMPSRVKKKKKNVCFLFFTYHIHTYETKQYRTDKRISFRRWVKE